MKIIVIENNKVRLNKFIDWLMYMVGYAFILIAVSLLFRSFEISNDYFGLYALIAAIIIYGLNKTIKPILFLLTLPITGITLGLFYPLINVFILYITDFILGSRFNLGNIFTTFVIAVLISIMNILLETLVIKPISMRNK